MADANAPARVAEIERLCADPYTAFHQFDYVYNHTRWLLAQLAAKDRELTELRGMLADLYDDSRAAAAAVRYRRALERVIHLHSVPFPSWGETAEVMVTVARDALGEMNRASPLRPLTPREAEDAYNAAPAVPISEERIAEIVRYATGQDGGGMTTDMPWRLSHRGAKAAVALADRHYSRQQPGTSQFVPPGRCLVLLGHGIPALWVTLWQRPEYTDHDWPGAWVCSLFRNESPQLSSSLIRHAVAATRWRWPEVPEMGMVTFVDPGKIRRKRDPGRCFLKAGFTRAGWTGGGLVVLQMRPEVMPPAAIPVGVQGVLVED